MGWNSSSIATSSFRRYLARLRKLITGAGLKVAQYVRPRQKAERPNGSTIRLEIGQMEGRESFNPVGQLGVAIGGAAALGALIHQLASAPASPAIAEVTPDAELAAAGEWEGHPPEIVIGASSDYPTVAYAGWQPPSLPDAEEALAGQFDDFFSAAARESGGGGTPASDGGGGGGGDPVSSGGFDASRSAEQPFAGNTEGNADPSGLDQSLPASTPQPAAAPAALDAGTQIQPLPPMVMNQFPFAGTGGIIEALPGTTVPSPSAIDDRVSFAFNQGQAAPEYRFVGESEGFNFALAPDKITFSIGHTPLADQIDVRFVGGHSSPQMVALDPQTPQAVSGFLAGAGTTYGQVNFQGVYEGINLDFYSNPAGDLEYDWVVAPGADPNQIVMEYSGVDRLALDSEGNLQLFVGATGLKVHAPVLYQQFGGVFEPVEGHYVVNGNQVTFAIGDYDKSRTLVIDPIVTWTGAGTTTNWSEANNWSGNAAPTSADTVVFNSTSTKNAVVDTSFAGTVTDVQLNSGYTGTVTLGGNLTISGDYSQAAGTFNTSGKTLFIGDDLAITAGTFTNTSGTLDFTSSANATIDATSNLGRIAVNKDAGSSLAVNSTNLAVNTFTLNSGEFVAPTGTLTVNGDFTGTGGTFTAGSGTVLFQTAASTTRTVSAGNLTLGNVTAALVNSGTLAVSGTLNVAQDLLLTGSVSSSNINGGTIAVAGNVDARATGYGGSVTVLLSGTGNQTVQNTTGSSASLRKLSINKASGSVLLDDDLVVNGAFTYTAGGWEQNDHMVTLQAAAFETRTIAAGNLPLDDVTLALATNGTLSVSGTLNVAGNLAVTGTVTGSNLDGGTIAAAGDVDIRATGYGGSSTLLLSGSGNQTLQNTTGSSASVRSLTINKPSGTVNLGDDVVVNGGFTYTAGGFDQANHLMTFQAGAFVTRTIAAGSLSLDDVTLALVTNGTLAVSGTLDVTGDLAVTGSGGVLNGGTIAAGGNVDVQATGYSGNANLLLSGSGNQTLQNSAGTSVSLLHLAINKPSGTVLVGDDLVLNGSFTYTAGGFDQDNHLITFTAGAFLTRTIAAGSLTLDDVTLALVTNGTLAVSGTLNVGGDLAVTGSGGVLNGGTIAAAGNVDVRATGYSGSATYLLSGTGNQTVQNSTGSTASLLHLTVNKPSGTLDLDDDLAINGSFTYTAGGFAQDGHSVLFQGGAFVTRTIAAGNLTLGDVILALVTNGTLAVTGNLNVDGNLTLTGNVTGSNVNGGNITVAGNVDARATGFGGTAALLLSGTGNQTIQNTTANSTSAYLNSLVVNKPSGNVLVSSTDLTLNNLTLTYGNFAAPAGNLTIQSSLTRTYGSFDPGSTGTVLFSTGGGSVTHTISLNGELDFHNLVFSDSGSGTKTYNIAANNTLFVAGNLTIQQQSGSTATELINGGTFYYGGTLTLGAGYSAGTPTPVFNALDAARGSISGTVYVDRNGDGLRQVGDSGLGGWTVELLDNTMAVVATAQTSTTGTYTFANITAGNYSVRETLQSGWTATTANAANVTVSAGSHTHVDFGDFQNISIGGQVFDDLDGDGVQDANEPGIDGVTVELYTMTNGVVGNAPVQTTVTDPGWWSFFGLTPLPSNTQYVVVQKLQAGWAQSWPIVGANLVTLPDGRVGYVVEAVSGVQITVPSGTQVVSGTGKVTLNALNNSGTATISYDWAGNVGGGTFYVAQFDVTYTDGSGAQANFDTFCVDLYHAVTVGQTYAVYVRGDTSTAFTPSGGAISYIYNTYGRQDLTGNNTQAAAVQIAIWYLSLNGHTPAPLTGTGGTYSDGTTAFVVSNLGANAGTIISLVNSYVAEGLANSAAHSGWLDASAAGNTPSRGQSVLLPTTPYLFGTFKMAEVISDDYEQSNYYGLDSYNRVSLLTGNEQSFFPICLTCGCPGGYCPPPVTTEPLSDPVLGPTALVYNSATANPQPVIFVAVHTKASDPAAPTLLYVDWTWDGDPQATVAVPVTGSYSPGTVFLVAVQVPDDHPLYVTTDLHDWTATASYLLPSSVVVDAGTASGTAKVLNRTDSPYGPGWGLAGIYEIIEVSSPLGGNGVFLAPGEASAPRFFKDAGNGTYTNPDNESGTLVKNGDGTYTYTTKHSVVYQFNTQGQEVSVQIGNDTSRQRTIGYDATTGGVANITSADNSTANFVYNSGNLAQVQLQNGNITIALRNAAGSPLTITNVDGANKTYEYNGNASPLGTGTLLTRDPWGPLDISFEYDEFGLLSEVDRGLGTTYTIKSQASQLLGNNAVSESELGATVTDALGRSTTSVLDTFGRLLKEMAPDASTQQWHRDQAGNVLQYIDQLGRTTSMTYASGSNDLLTVTRPDSSSVAYQYDATFHFVTAYVDSLGRRTTYTYDPDTGDLLTVRDAQNKVTTYTYQEVSGISNGLLVSVTDALGRTTLYDYDPVERHLEAVTDAEGNTTSYTYDAIDNLVAITDALGRITSMAYDGARRVTQVTDPNGGTMTMAYDAIGNLVSQTDQLGRHTNYVFDQRGFLSTATEAVGTGVQRTSTLVYDVVGNLLSTVDPLGRTTSFAYDNRDRMVRTIEAYGTSVARTSTVVYDAVSNVVGVVNPRGFTSSLVYDNRDRLIQTVEAVGTSVQRTASMAYDSESNLLSTTDALGRRASYVYDSLNRLTSMTEAVGTSIQRTSTMAYDAVHNLTSSTDALGRVTSYVYNNVDLVTRVTEAVGTSVQRSTSVAYDAVYNVINSTDALGRHASYTFDALDRMTALTEAVGTSVQRTSTMAYDAVSNLTGTTDPLGRRSAYTYDALNRLSSMTEAVGTSVQRTTTTMAYDAVDNYVSTTDALGRVTNFSFDALNRMVSMTEAAGTGVQRTSTMAYDANDNLVSATNPRGFVSAYSFDALDRMTSTTEAVGTSVERTSTFAFDAMSNLVNSTDALGRHTSYAFDALDRITSMTEAVGTSVQRTSTFAFDAMNNLTGSTDALGRRAAYAFDALDRMTGMTEAVGTSVQRTNTWAYDANNNLVSQTDALGRVTAYAFDSLDRMSSMTEAVGTGVQRTSTWTYDAASNLSTSIDALGRVSSYAYDALDRMTTMTEAVGASVQRTSTFAFDAVSNLIGSTDALGRHTSYAFDALDRMTGMTEAVGLSLQRTSTWAYDANSNLVSQTDALGRVASFAFDALDRMSAITETAGTSVQRTSTMAYDAVDNYVSTTDALGRVTNFSFDALNRTVSMTEAAGTSVQRTSTWGYDAVSNLVSETDALGRVTSYAFDALNRMTAMTEAVGASVQRTSTFAFDAVDNLVNQTDALGRRTSYTFDALNRMTAMTEAVGTSVQRTGTFAFDAVDNLVNQTDALGRHNAYAFDALNRMTSMTEATGTSVERTSTFAFDAVDNLVNQTDALGRHTAYAFDALNRMTSTTEAVGTGVQRTSTFAFDAVDNLVNQTDALGRHTAYGFDALDRMVTMTEATGTSVQRTSTVAYDAVDNVLASIDPLGRATSYAYDALDRRISTTDALNQKVTVVYDAVDNVVAVVNKRNFTTSYAYDALDRQTTRTDALSQVASTVYDAMDNVLAVIDERSNATSYAYDALNRQVSRKDALNHTTSTVYDAVSNVVASIDALGFASTFTYDALDRMVTAKAPSGGVSTTIYDAVSNVVGTIDPVGNRTTFVLDALDRRTQTIDARGGVVTVLYDAVSNNTAIVDPVGNRTTMVYDALNRQVERIDALGNSGTMIYDAADRLTSKTDRNGRRIDYTYDAIDRETAETWIASNGSTVDNRITFTYDPNDNVLTAADSDGAYTFTYDALDRTVAQKDVFGLTLTFGYDATSNRTSVQDSLGGVQTSVYDAVNRLTRRSFTNGTTPLRADFTYTARDQVETVTRYSDLAGTSLVGTSSYTYDSTGRMSTLEHRNASSTVLASYVYSYDLADRLTSESIGGLVRYYVYDATNQLTSDNGTGYTYDLNGNRNDGSYSAGPSNQLQTDGTWNYTYDDEGNTTKKVRISDGQTWTYGYDQRNMMVFAEQRTTDGGTLLQRLDFEYDVFGNRIEKSVTTSSTTVQRFSWDGRDIWADLDGSSSLTTRRVFGDGVNEPLARITSNAEWYLQDRMGSVRDVVGPTGTVVAHAGYDAWGLVTGSSGTTDRYLAFAYQLDAQSGLYYVMARYMDPVTHLFLQQDPIYADVNGYRYAGNSPTNATDPSGLGPTGYDRVPRRPTKGKWINADGTPGTPNNSFFVPDDPKLRAQLPNGRIQYVDGVQVMPAIEGVQVEIQMTGVDETDFKRARAKFAEQVRDNPDLRQRLGISEETSRSFFKPDKSVNDAAVNRWQRSESYVWDHRPDLKHMRLVNGEVHGGGQFKGIPHTGGSGYAAQVIDKLVKAGYPEAINGLTNDLIKVAKERGFIPPGKGVDVPAPSMSRNPAAAKSPPAVATTTETTGTAKTAASSPTETPPSGKVTNLAETAGSAKPGVGSRMIGGVRTIAPALLENPAALGAAAMLAEPAAECLFPGVAETQRKRLEGDIRYLRRLQAREFWKAVERAGGYAGVSLEELNKYRAEERRKFEARMGVTTPNEACDLWYQVELGGTWKGNPAPEFEHNLAGSAARWAVERAKERARAQADFERWKRANPGKPLDQYDPDTGETRVPPESRKPPVMSARPEPQVTVDSPSVRVVIPFGPGKQ